MYMSLGDISHILFICFLCSVLTDGQFDLGITLVQPNGQCRRQHVSANGVSYEVRHFVRDKSWCFSQTNDSTYVNVYFRLTFTLSQFLIRILTYVSCVLNIHNVGIWIKQDQQ